MHSKLFLISLGVIAFSLFGLVNACNASDINPILSDDFNGYAQGKLDGQGGWIDSTSGAFIIDGTECLEGLCVGKKVNYGGSGDFRISKTGESRTAMSMTFYVKLGRSSCIENCHFTGTPFLALGIPNAPQWWGFYQDASGRVFSPFGKMLGTLENNAWTPMIVTTSQGDGSVKISVTIGDQAPSEWENAFLASFNTVSLMDGLVDASEWRIDFIGYGPHGLNDDPVEEKNPVLIIPGLMGTEMKNGEELLWPDLGRMFIDHGDEFMDILGFNNDLNPVQSSVYSSTVFLAKSLGLITFDYTAGLINEFQSQGYIENETLFLFPYDWRYGAAGVFPDGRTNADLLAQKIEEIRAQTGSRNVDVIAHSLGGLVLKKYVMDRAADHHIAKAVLVGVPNTGAPKAVKIMLQGDNFGIPWLSQQEMKKLAQYMPVSYELLPSRRYYDAKGSFVTVVTQPPLGQISGASKKELDYEEFKSFLLDDHGLHEAAFAGAGSLHSQAFDDFNFSRAGVDAYNITGCKTATIGKIIEDRYKNVFGQHIADYKRPVFVPGDNTVPLESSTNLPVSGEKKFYLLTADHSRMLSQDGSRQQIVNIISGSALPVADAFITQDGAHCALNGKAISVFSPVTIVAIDQDGNKTGLLNDGSLVNEIPNADFHVLGGHKFLYLPTDGGQRYDVRIFGTGEGTFTLTSQDIVRNETVKSEVFSNIPVEPGLAGTLAVAPLEPAVLSLQQDLLSEPLVVLPSATVENQSDDVLPPATEAIIEGQQGQPGFYRSGVTVALHAYDGGESSGVLGISYSLDGGVMQRLAGGSAAVAVAGEGEHTLLFFATDNAGNNEPAQLVKFIVDLTPPEAAIVFEASAGDVAFSGHDNITPGHLVTVIDGGDTVTIADQAGNATIIALNGKNRKAMMAAEITAIAYNGAAADMGDNAMRFAWSYDRRRNLKALSQRVTANAYNLVAVYNGSRTKVLGKDSSGKISETIAGLALVRVSTHVGTLRWSY